MNAPAPFSLAGMTALVTGGGSGLGYSISECLIACGAQVAIVGRDADRLKIAARTLGNNAYAIQADVTDYEMLDGVVARCQNRFGSLDLLVNNAGNHVKKSYDSMTVAEVEALMGTHVIAGFALTKACLPLLRQSKAASVIFIASMASYLSIPYIIGYTAAKSAVLGLVRGSAADLSGDGIRANGIAPGWIATSMSEKAMAGDPERKAKILSRTPMHRFGQPSDIGWAAAYLASPAARFVNGHVLAVDGGAVSGF